MTKLDAQYQNLQKALARLKEGIELPFSEVSRDATIQRFEFTFELSWKLMQSIVRENKPEVAGVRTIIRVATDIGLIDDPLVWFDFLDKRNLTVHTYEEAVAQMVYEAAKLFLPEVEKLVNRIKERKLVKS